VSEDRFTIGMSCIMICLHAHGVNGQRKERSSVARYDTCYMPLVASSTNEDENLGGKEKNEQVFGVPRLSGF